MIDYNLVTDSDIFLRRYWKGGVNRAVRYWTFAREGMGVLNEWRYYVMFFFGTVWTVEYIPFFGKIPQWVVVAGAIIGIPLLLLVGRWHIYRAKRPQQYIQTIHGSITQFQGHNIGVFNIELMKAIAEKLGVDVKNIENKLEESIK